MRNMGKGVMLDDLVRIGAWDPIPFDSVGRQLMNWFAAKVIATLVSTH
jgi:hypothetical protein